VIVGGIRVQNKWVTISGLVVAWLLPASVFGATTPNYYAGTLEDTRWQLQASVFACKLYQPLDRVGEAVFMRRAGEEQRFYLAADNRLLATGPATIEATAPLWQPFYRSEKVHNLSVSEGDEPVQLDWRDSQALAAQLHQGQQLALTAEAWHDSSQQVSIAVASTGFAGAFRDFLTCSQQLLPANYDQINRSSIQFLSAALELDDEQKVVLDHLVRYVLADPHVTAVVIDGHSDGVGLRADNLVLSQQRAEAVYNYLIERGLSEELIQVRWHGERYPIASNRTPEGREQNRRVTLRVDRFEPEHLAVK